ncbi:hypothetical protein ACIRTB_23130 [Streptomyces sp. NPDC101158]|uniref:hypothetical protein n=1 Tax=Streptomyces sp. NPDC101158 TaxID=3366117 RepID=UPI0037F179D2
MAMWETILATVSGLGGAGLGAASTLFVQRAKRRDDAAAAALAAQRSAEAAREAAEREAGLAREAFVRETERADKAAAEAESSLTLEMIATARVAARLWLITAERAISDLQRGQAAAGERYDEQLQEELKEFTSTLYRLSARRRLPNQRHPELGTGGNVVLVELLSETSQYLRDALRISADARLPPNELEVLLWKARDAFQTANAYLIDSTEAIAGRQVPFVERVMPAPREH